MKYRDRYTSLFFVKNFLFLTSFGLLITMVVNSYDIVKFKINGIKVEGVVIDVEKRQSGRYAIWHHTIEYLVNNKTYNCEKKFNSGFNPTHSLNEKVKVLYLERNPNESKLDSNDEVYYLPIGIMGLSLLFFLVGYFINKYPEKTLELMNNN